MIYIYGLIGKSSSGKDTIAKHIVNTYKIPFLVPFTTRPMRNNEKQNVDYHFVSDIELNEMFNCGDILETRSYMTAQGKWTYGHSKSFLEDEKSYIAILPPSACKSVSEVDGINLVPIYIKVNDGERLIRSLQREMENDNPDYSEICRRFLADEKDFSKEKLDEINVQYIVENKNLTETFAKIGEIIINKERELRNHIS